MAGKARALTVAGSDSGGGAGLQADLRVFAAFGVYGMSAVTAVTVQNTQGVRSVTAMPPEVVSAQMDAVLSDIGADSVKIGMLHDAGTIRAVAASLAGNGCRRIVVDPVMLSKNGRTLLEPSALDCLVGELLPLADLVTPNVPEAEMLTGMKIRSTDDMAAAAGNLHARCARNGRGPSVLVKGGHLEGDCTDVLVEPGADGLLIRSDLPAERIATRHTHGTGCTLSSAIAAGLALGGTIRDSTEAARAYLLDAIREAPGLGKGAGPLEHFPQGRGGGYMTLRDRREPEGFAVAAAIERIRLRRPLVHCLTNPVTMNDCANLLLAAGASPIMADAPEEAAEITRRADALVLNAGVPSAARIEAMRASAGTAVAAGIRSVLDVVGCGASRFRTELCVKLAREAHPAVIRGNRTELRCLAGALGLELPQEDADTTAPHGVDAAITDLREDSLGHALKTAAVLSRALDAVVVATGRIDVVCKGSRVETVVGGHPMMARVTGTGCMGSALTGALLGAGLPAFEAARMAAGAMSASGEAAWAACGQNGDGAGTGTFRVRMIDAISVMEGGRRG